MVPAGQVREQTVADLSLSLVLGTLIGTQRCSVSLLMCSACGRRASVWMRKAGKWREACRELASSQVSNWNTGLRKNVVRPVFSGPVYIFQELSLLPSCSVFCLFFLKLVIETCIQKSAPFLIVQFDKFSEWFHPPVQQAPRSRDRIFQPHTNLFHAPIGYYPTPKITTIDSFCLFLYFTKVYTFILYINGITQRILFCDWLVPFNNIFVRFIHVVCGTMGGLFSSLVCPFSWGWTVSRFWLM